MRKTYLNAGAMLLAGIFLQAVGALLAGAAAPAKAEMLSFWEDEKPSVTGARKARRSAEVDQGDDEERFVRRKAKSRAKPTEAWNDDDAPRRKQQRRVRVASLGKGDAEDYVRPQRRSITGGGSVSWSAPSGCLNGTLASLVQQVSDQYGSVTVTSTCRSRGQNAAAGGARHSQHLTGDAVDFRVHGNVSGAIAYLRNNGSVGGFHHYGGGLIHIDTGPKRTW